jgi:hypothetical protein
MAISAVAVSSFHHPSINNATIKGRTREKTGVEARTVLHDQEETNEKDLNHHEEKKIGI